ncbi:MAG: GH13_18 / GH13 / GH13_4 / GH13_16 / GH13_36 [uncultured Nocardioidaceae bacterium]|uniref:GH13_18 / GH13 / GH13_4 / GH13_16 / GH13_36 n=1 Tax=uncultured Nocardioidaceae bacterium TaxID=253824 RepID=A0A6J4KX92_9ACTN|nr:MAG: GH13_18 / GH13 / GH13_4 / GH13_16 / GH13_36 [uncultured Nocardioidaceae bacterium]
MALRNAVQLITYADRLGGDLPGLQQLLDGPLAGVFGGVHVLPFFPPYDGADAGFDPVDHTAVDPRLGTWEDVTSIGRSLDLVVDVIVNHVSADAPQFQDYLAHGPSSAYADMFLTMSKVYPDGVTEEGLLTLYRPRPGLPFSAYVFADGAHRLLWTTFTSRQIDLDVHSRQARRYLGDVLERLAASGAAMIRLDAVGYAVKTPGTRSFMTPETFAMIDELSAQARSLNLEVLVEVHSHYKKQIEIGARVDWVYDFALPPLILHTLTASDADALLRWLEVRPHNAVTVLDTHDGIGVVDVGADSADKSLAGLLANDDIDALVESIHANSGGTSRRATGAAASNVDLYQVNCTYYDALGRNDEHYLLARLLQFFTPGIPQVYYVGLLAGSNDMELLERTKVGRDVNRHHYRPEEVAAALERPVVSALMRLIRFRNTHPAFQGDLSFTGGGRALELAWRHGTQSSVLSVDLSTSTYTLTWTDEGEEQSVNHVRDLPY